jgi:hypothetical protein
LRTRLQTRVVLLQLLLGDLAMLLQGDVLGELPELALLVGAAVVL